MGLSNLIVNTVFPLKIGISLHRSPCLFLMFLKVQLFWEKTESFNWLSPCIQIFFSHDKKNIYRLFSPPFSHRKSYKKDSESHRFSESFFPYRAIIFLNFTERSNATTILTASPGRKGTTQSIMASQNAVWVTSMNHTVPKI